MAVENGEWIMHGLDRNDPDGEEYGWSIAILSRPEDIWGYEFVTSEYREDPDDSAKKIRDHILEIYPGASGVALRRMIGIGLDKPERKPGISHSSTDYPTD